MHPFKALRRFALVLAAFGVGAVATSMRGPIGSVPGLRQRLESRVDAILAYPRGRGDWHLLGQELVDEIEAMVNMAVDGLSEFADDYEACQQIAERPLNSLGFSGPGSYTTTDYTRRYQDPLFLCNLGTSYRNALYDITKIVGLLRGVGPQLLDALRRFFKYNTQALRMRWETDMYHKYILRSSPEAFLGGPMGTTGPVEAAVSQAVEGEVGEFKRTVCADYEALTKGAAALFDRMIEELGDILGGLKGARRDGAY